MLVLWLGLCALEASPDLHHRLHKDSQNPDHNCLVTQLQHHLLLAGVVLLAAAVAPTLWVWVAVIVSLPILPSCDYRLLPGRAPPVA